MKILVVCQFYYPENFVITKIAEELVAKGHSVDVLTGKPNYGYGYILEEYKNISIQNINGVNVHRVNLYPRKKSRISIIRNYLSFYFNSKKWVRKCKEQYDVVYSMSLSPVTICCAGNLYKKKRDVKHIIHCVDLWPESVLVTHAVKKDSLVYKILYKWSRSIYSKADKILIGSPSFSEYFAEILKLPNVPLKYVPQCSMIEESDATEYKFGPGTHILYCGNLGIIQLIPLITETMKIMDNKNVFFHVIGMGPMSNYLLDEIKNSGLGNNLIYHGPMPATRAASYIKGCDAMYISLESTGVVGKTIPNKVMMAMAFGKPIIGVIQGDGKKVLSEAGGCLLSGANTNSLKNTINALYNMDEKTKKRFGELNKNYYITHFSKKFITEEIEKALKE